jgi:hypothetical protein
VSSTQAAGERDRARAELLSDEEEAAIWDDFRDWVPMIHVYEGRTDGNIRVLRIRRLEND